VLFVYGTPGGGVPRDTAQAMLRCRVLTTNHLVYFLDTRMPRPSVVGLDAGADRARGTARPGMALGARRMQNRQC
jgi:hypothetical protein